jgi:hypothetical protein
MKEKLTSFLPKKKNSQAGFSLVMALVALALVGAGTSYIMSINKHNKVTTARARSTSFAELEKRRISAALSDVNICKLTQNFGGAAYNIPKTKLYKDALATPTVLVSTVAPNNKYYNNVLTLNSFQLTGPGTTSKNYELVLTYFDASDPTNLRSAYTGKPSTIIRIPMYVKIVGGVVEECYARPERSEIDQVITAACSPAAITGGQNNYNKSTLSNIGGVVTDCKNDLGFDAANNSTCPATKVMTGFNIVGNNLSFPTATYCSGLTSSAATSCSPAGTSAYRLNASTLTCGYVGADAKDTDGGSAMCGAGQIIWRVSSAATTCISVNCAAAYAFVQAVSNAGVTCFTAPATTCGSNQYVSAFSPSGDTCSDLPVLSTGSNCNGSTTFGYSITRATTTAGGVLNCAGYTKTKACGSPSNTTFAYALNPTNASCTQW